MHCNFKWESIHNNNLNKIDSYFKLFVGNTEIYTSGPIKPLEYVPKISLNNQLPMGDTDLMVEYYLYDEETKTFTDTKLGSGKVINKIKTKICIKTENP